jgi:hypothetical protein
LRCDQPSRCASFLGVATRYTATTQFFATGLYLSAHIRATNRGDPSPTIATTRTLSSRAYATNHTRPRPYGPYPCDKSDWFKPLRLATPPQDRSGQCGATCQLGTRQDCATSHADPYRHCATSPVLPLHPPCDKPDRAAPGPCDMSFHPCSLRQASPIRCDTPARTVSTPCDLPFLAGPLRCDRPSLDTSVLTLAVRPAVPCQFETMRQSWPARASTMQHAMPLRFLATDRVLSAPASTMRPTRPNHTLPTTRRLS